MKWVDTVKKVVSTIVTVSTWILELIKRIFGGNNGETKG